LPETDSVKVVEIASGVRFEVWAKPRAKKSRVVGEREDAIEVSIGAPPVDCAANTEHVRFQAEILGVPKRAVSLVRGETSHRKLIEVAGVTAESVRTRLFGP
jgi:uncharacterized protein (TIGR00251 family)